LIFTLAKLDFGNLFFSPSCSFVFSKRNDILSFIDKKYLETLPVNDNGIKMVNKNIKNDKNKKRVE
jgi:hypothetical protein